MESAVISWEVLGAYIQRAVCVKMLEVFPYYEYPCDGHSLKAQMLQDLPDHFLCLVAKVVNLKSFTFPIHILTHAHRCTYTCTMHFCVHMCLCVCVSQCPCTYMHVCTKMFRFWCGTLCKIMCTVYSTGPIMDLIMPLWLSEVMDVLIMD